MSETMQTSSGNFPPERLTKIDKLSRPEHLEKCDKCYYLGEYTIGGGWQESATNQVILNYKMVMSLKAENPQRWQHKQPAIEKVARAFWNKSPKKIRKFLMDSVLVPLPPSKAQNHKDYDDRNMRMLKFLKKGLKKKTNIKLDVKELILQEKSRPSLHESSQRLTVEEIQENYKINTQKLPSSAPKYIALFDDTLINGTTFCAAKRCLKEQYPDCEIRGFFIALGKYKDIMSI